MSAATHYLKDELYDLVRRDDSIFEFLQAGSLDGLWFWDLESPNEEWLSPRFKEVFGYADHEIPNTVEWWQKNIFPEDLPVVLANFKKHCADPSHPYDQIVRYRHRNGSTVWVRCRGIVIRNQAGKPVRMLGAHTDVTELMRSQQEAAQEAARAAVGRRFQEISESLPQLVWTAGRDGSLDWLGPQWVAYTGIPEREQLGHGWLRPVHPADRAGAESSWMEAVARGDLFETEFRIRRHDGVYRWFKTRATPMPDAHGEISRWFGTNTDIQGERDDAERMRREVADRTAELAAAMRLQQAVLNGTVFGIIATAVDGTITVFNEGAEEMLGHRAEDVVGKATPALFHDRNEVEARAKALTGELGRVVEPGFDVFVLPVTSKRADERVWTYVRKDGTRFPVSLNITALRDGEGVVNGYLGVARDISVRRRAEEARDAEKQRLEKLGREVPGLLYQFRLRPDGSSCFPFATRGIEKIYGVKAQEVKTDASVVFERIHPDDLAGLRESIARSAETLERWTYEFRVRHADGAVRWVRGDSTPEREADGSVLWHGYISDVTERRLADQIVHENEERFRSAFEYAGIGKAIVALDGGFIQVNQAFCDIVDYPADQLCRLTFADITHADDLALDLQNLADLTAGKTRSYQMEKRYLKRSGGIVWVRLTVSMVTDKTGAPLQYIAQVEDINHRHLMQRQLAESEERMRLFAEHAPASVAMFDRNMCYLVASKQWLEDYKLTGQSIIGRSHYRIFPEIGDEWKAVHRRCLDGAIESRDADLFQRADGSSQWLRWEVRPWHDGTGKIGGIVMFTADITRQKELETNLATARDDALEASRLKSEFLATMSHEIRTPMNAVIGMAELLLDSDLHPAQSDMVRTIVAGADSLLAIINDILDFSRIESGRMRLDPEEFELRRVVEETVALLEPRAQAKRLDMTWRIHAEREIRLWGDVGRVRQILTNLIGNAVKFTDHGKVAIEVRPRNVGERRVGVRIDITDTGIGIPAEVQPKLFQAFVQADGSTTRRFGGTGLGLAICRQLVELMNGRIGLESRPGQGSHFWVELEFEVRGDLSGLAGPESSPDASARGEPPAAKTMREPEPALGLRVLLVEDNEANQRVGRLLLDALGCESVVAENGRVALAKLAEHRFDVVLMDCQMPEMDGYETTRRIRQGGIRGVPASIPIIALTAYARQEDRERCLSAGMDDYMTKPVRLAGLRTALEQHVPGGQRGSAGFSAPPESDGPSGFDEDVWQAMQNLRGDDGQSLAHDLARMYLNDANPRIDRIATAFGQGRYEEAAIDAHGLAGNAAAIGGRGVRAPALELEEAARRGDVAAFNLCLSRVRRICDDFEGELKRRLSLTDEHSGH